MIVKEAVNHFLESKRRGGRRLRTVTTYQERLLSFVSMFGRDDIATLGESDIEKWAAGQYKGEGASGDPLSPATVAGRIGAVQIFVKWLYDRKHIDHDIARHLIRPKGRGSIAPKAMIPDDFLTLARYAQDNSIRNFAIILTLGDSGCRVGELCSLTIDTIDLAAGVATVEGKSGPRFIDYTTTTAAAITAWLDQRPPVPHPYLFTSQSDRMKGQPITPNGIRIMLNRVAAAAGVGGRVNPHSFRHMVGYLWARQGVPLAVIQKKLGHRDLTTTTIYTQQNIEEVQKYTGGISVSNLINKDNE